MQVMRRIWALSLLLCICAADLEAQAPEVQPGTRVRIAQPGANGRPQQAVRWSVGTVEAVDSASLTLRSGGMSLVYPFAAISRMEVSQGRQGGSSASAARGFRRGALTGAASGAALAGFVRLRDREPCEDCGSISFERFTTRADTETFALTVGLGALVGGGVGLIVGSQSSELWSPVAVGGALSVSWTVDPVPSGGTGVGVSLRF